MSEQRKLTHCVTCGALSDWCAREGGCCYNCTHRQQSTHPDLAKIAFPHVGNGECDWCNRNRDGGNLFKAPDGKLVCADCRNAYQWGARHFVPPAVEGEMVPFTRDELRAAFIDVLIDDDCGVVTHDLDGLADGLVNTVFNRLFPPAKGGDFVSQFAPPVAAPQRCERCERELKPYNTGFHADGVPCGLPCECGSSSVHMVHSSMHLDSHDFVPDRPPVAASGVQEKP